MDPRFRQIHGNLTEHILAPDQVGEVRELKPEPGAELRLTPDTKVLCIHRGRNERREGCLVGLEDPSRLDRERSKGVAYRGDIVDTLGGQQYIIPPGHFTVAYGAALHFKNRAVVPGSRNPETHWQASFIAILGIWSATAAGPKIIAPVDPPEEWAPFTDDELRRYSLAAEPGRASTIGPIDPHVAVRRVTHNAGNIHGAHIDEAAALSADRAASLTYEPYYGLKEKPFSLSADPRFLYKSRSHAPAFDDLSTAVRRREGLIVLTGDIGTGKTTVCRAVLQQLNLKTFTTVVADRSQSREDLLRTLLVDFGVMSIDNLKSGRLKGASRADLIYPLYEFLDSLVPLQTFAVLMIDEAQNLSLPLFEEIRLLSDLEGRKELLQVVLVGQIDFRSQLKLPEMRQINQRVSVHCELEPLSREEVTGYVTDRLRVAGGGDDRIAFSPKALDLVYSESDGVPRLVNLLCDRALHHAWVKRTATVEPDEVWKAVDDLGLSAPPAQAAPGSSNDHRPPRGMFERATQVGEPKLPSDADLRTLLTLSPVTRQVDRSPAEAGRAETGPPDALAAFPIEPQGERRPESRTVRQQVQPGQQRPTRRVSPLVLALAVATALAGGAALALGSQRAIRLFVADLLSTAAAPSPQPSPVAPIPQVPLPTAPPTLQDVRPPVLPGSSSAPGTETAEPYVIQIASFESAPLANSLVKALRDKGYRAYAVEVNLGARGLFHRVFVGRYRTLDEAASDLARIRQIPGYGDAKILDAQQSHIALEAR